MVAEDGEALVGVDAAPAGPRDRARALERETGGVSEQVTHRRAGRPGRLVEVDDAFLGGDERRERADGLRDRGEEDGATGIAVRRDRGGCVGHPGRGEGNVPHLDLAQSVHFRWAILPLQWNAA